MTRRLQKGYELRRLLNGLPQADLGLFPTPLQRLPRLGANLFIKRDDMTGLGLGGNKTRGLRFLLGDAKAKGCDTVLTAGGLQSNLCSLTAASCCKMGLKCILIHNDDRPPQLQGNMLLNSLFGAQSVFLGKTDENTRALAVETLGAELSKKGLNPYIIHNGASTPLGALGYAAAALELYEQAGELGLPLKHVGMVGAMGGTASGFIFGTALLGAPFHVHVISVEYPKETLTGILHELVEGMAQVLSCPVPPIDSVMTVYDRYLGEGYAIPTATSKRTLLDLARQEGLVCENVYTAKTLAGLLDLIDTGSIPSGETSCFVHTGGLGALFAQEVPT